MTQAKKCKKVMTMKKQKNTSIKIQEKMKCLIEKKEIDDPVWKSVTNTPGLDIWRVKNLKLEVVPKDQHGTFYDGDSYIILNTFEDESKKIMYDVFMWIGLNSTPDEYGVAAYKITELNRIILNGESVQHREVQSNESEKFQALFKKFSILKGGSNGGLKKVDRSFKPRLLQISGIGKNVIVTEVSYRRDNLSSSDVFIIDTGDNIYQINGKDSRKDEKFKGAQVINEIKNERGKCVSEIIENYSPGLTHPAIENLPVKNKCTTIKKARINKEYKLFQLSDAAGKLLITHIKDGKCKLKNFNTKDVLIYDTNVTIYIWIGKKASKNERTMAMVNAQKYAEDHNKKNIPLVSMVEGDEALEFLLELEK